MTRVSKRDLLTRRSFRFRVLLRSGRVTFHWEIKGRFHKRVVLANVPSFRFSFRGNIRRNHPFGNHPFVNTKKGHWEIKGRFHKRVVLANVPSFRFSFRGNIRQNHPLGNRPFRFPRTFLSETITVIFSIITSIF